VWTEVQTVFAGVVRLRAGGRGALVHARADELPARDSAGIDRVWLTAVGNTGISWQAVPWLQLLFNVDQGFRAPNLDDLTSRQQTGPGFQFENPDLEPERSVGLEAGFKIRHPVIEVDGWAFQTYGYRFMERAARTVEDCPMGDDGCGASQTRFQLVNLDGRAILRGAEGDVRLFLPADLLFRANVSYTWGEGPNPAFAESPDQPRRVPLSRIPPLHGIVDFGWRSHRWGVYAFTTMRWATLQDRLAPQDANLNDPRIPRGGTPGYVTVDLRAGYRIDPWVLFGVVFENVGDAAYRVHGSSVNGPGRGIIAHAEFGF
jgi:iron complex outermembrane receptor protein/hemoglobin/transferrin/lactoferrin receptor protein